MSGGTYLTTSALRSAKMSCRERVSVAGVESSSFANGDVAFLLSSDAMVRVGGLPITLQVPDYGKLYAQGKSVADCAQNAGQGLSNGDLSYLEIGLSAR